MDSLSQAVLGASIVAAAVPATQRRLGLLAGAILGTVPDLDTLIVPLFTQAPVSLFTWHRGPSHALWLLLLLALLLWWALKKISPAVRQAPRAWLIATALALITHPLLDAFTVYGTQLWWPTSSSPVMWASLFIIDPLYTLPLLVGVLAVLLGGPKRWAFFTVVTGLVLSTAYIGWSHISRSISSHAVAHSLQQQGLGGAPYLLIATPFNTLLWRVVVITEQGHAVGYRSIFDGDKTLQLSHYPSQPALLQEQIAINPEVARLAWFTSGFINAEVRDRQLIINDLRMGTEGHFTFAFEVAQNVAPDGAAPQWQSHQVAPMVKRSGSMAAAMNKEWQATWGRIVQSWRERSAS
ncbi:metal-dependent hydrolase [Lampropedia aestuarii]|uniref:Metal-dependent hydrolase n=1 Tax=Lampropedia aestuarii TaxID=2562762 RepID=A0A4S5BMX7_9BURK|nr:metal-dependent hydrolase [Lampropedia aestuarii]THJ32245.1 metal-dependent hydrolase [Lampropedia aestuarii]